MQGTRTWPGELYLSGIHIAAGDQVSIFDIPELAEGDLLARLRAGGLLNVKVFSRPEWQMAASCARATVGRVGHDVALDTVIYASDGRDAGQNISRFLHAAGLGNVVGIGTNLNGCANFGAMLTVSGALVGSGSSTGCLLVSVDSVPPERNRLLSGDIGVLSDVAASAVVSTDATLLPAYRILGVASAASAELALAESTQDGRTAAADFFDGIDDALARLASDTGTELSEFVHVISNNYTYPAVAALHEIAGIGMDRAYRATAAEFGHCHAADGLVSLDHLRREGLVRDGDKVLVLSTSTSTWFVTALRYVADESAAGTAAASVIERTTLE